MKTNLSNPVKLILLLVALMAAAEIMNAQTYSNLALNKPATASSLEGTGNAASMAVDNNMNTRFSSGFTDNEWISVDLGSLSLVKTVVLTWERAYGTDFNILFSNDGSFRDLYPDSIQVRNNVLTNNSTAGINTITMKANTIARYVRMQGVHRSGGYGYSLWDMQVMGTHTFTPAGTLPVTLTNFMVAGLNAGNRVSWTTLVENNNAGFSIERSTDGNAFNAIGWIAGQNRGSVVLNYTFIDNQSLPGRSYYRIRQVDADGKAVYTTALVINKSTAADVKTYPLPVKDHLVIEYTGTIAEKISIVIYDAAGRSVYSNAVNMSAGTQAMSVSRTADMKTGIYFLKINSSTNLYTKELVIQ